MINTAKIKWIIVILAFFTGRQCKLYGQLNATVKDNVVENSRNLSIGGTLLGIDLYNPNLNFFIEGKLNYRFKKELGWIKGNYSVAFADRLEEITESTTAQEAVPANGTKPLKTYGLSFGYNFVRKEDFTITKATFLRRSGAKSVKLPVKSCRVYGVHVGLEYFRTIIAQGSSMSYTGNITANYPRDTTVVTGNATPMFSMKIISVGIHRQIIEHSVIQINNGGELKEYKNKGSSMVYADFLIGTSMTFENVLTPLNGNGPNANPANSYGSNSNNPYNFYSVDINNSYKKVPIGGRIGWEHIGLGPVGSIIGFECGFRPGILKPADNAYIMMKIGLSFNVKAK